MANGNYTIYVPDRSAPISFPSSMTHEEVKAALIGSGYTSVENSELVVSGNTLTFRRVTGGSKGI